LLTTDYWETWRNELKSIKDIEKLNRQLYLKKITPQNLFYFYDNLSNIQSLYSNLSSDSHINHYLNNKITMNIQDICKKFKQVFEETFILDECKNINTFDFDINFIKEGINKELDKYVELNQDSKSKIECMRVYLDDLIAKGEKSKKNDFVKIHSTDKNGFNLQCTSRRSKILAEQIKDKISEELTFIK
jgi:DNA mismatch repair ATPase MutS